MLRVQRNLSRQRWRPRRLQILRGDLLDHFETLVVAVGDGRSMTTPYDKGVHDA